jgi:beta-lactamase class A
VLLAVPGSAQAWHPHVYAASKYAQGRAGQVTFAVRTPRRLYGRGVTRTVPSASVLKAMLLVSYLRRHSVRHRRLRPADRRLIVPMVRWSDNFSASVIRRIVGDRGLRGLARRAHMRRFRPASPWGVSRIDAADQARFLFRIDRLVPRRHRRTALRLLGSIVRPQRWGIGHERPRGWALYFKGGWGSGTGWVDHQVALLRRGRRRLSVAILTTNSPSHAYGKRTLRGVAARLLRGLKPSSVPR